MAKKRRTRRRKTMRESGGTLSRRRKTTRRRRRRGLSEALTFAKGNVGDTVRAGVSGFVGGMASNWLSDTIAPESRMGEFALNTGLAFAACLMGMPNTGAGVMGAYGQRVADRVRRGLRENADYADSEALSEDPVFLDENGTPLYLNEEDGNFYYMGEDGNYYLADNGDDVQYLAEAPYYLAEQNGLPVAYPQDGNW
jgi:hypothetical protein